MSDNSEQIELLREIAKWSRFMGFKQVKEVLESQLTDEKKTLAYYLSDGKNTSTVIAKTTGINQPKVTELWKEWASMGLGESISVSGGSRFKRSFDPKMFGFSLPEIKQKSLESKENTDFTLEETSHEQ
ncbi:hypothetical protein [Nitrosarchaeum sp. AC2]|uniref:hypothetical protein n=1 Tax=Nitrosarchaeum sp. AC2 TaxID=2259673 RepID=UPI0015CADC78|nr:hypothetical protein [Nitrosarchaeum sp. AC2]QLH11267.1 hypothetical protein DSQ20_07185 [Nitrosarchaeum sp. AC2]